MGTVYIARTLLYRKYKPRLCDLETQISVTTVFLKKEFL